MKYSAFLAVLATSLPSSWAADEKPDFKCAVTGPTMTLGGYNVNGNLYSTDQAMLQDLWREDDNDIRATRDLNVDKPEQSHFLEGRFTFNKRGGEYLGIGASGWVQGQSDEYWQNNEGLYITFPKYITTQVNFGIRGDPEEITNPVPIPERDLVSIYNKGVRIDKEKFKISSDHVQGEDKQERFDITSETPFDAISFVTRTYDYEVNYFLEYLDICTNGDISKLPPKATVTGDPHFRTWSGTKYDFHGICDLVLLQNPSFQKGLGMDIHIRTKQMKKFSYVSAAVLQIGDETLEVMGDVHENMYWINKQSKSNADNGIIGVISGYPISYQKVNSNQHEFTVNVGGQQSIIMTTFKKMIRVSIRGATKESFGESLGLLGVFGSGKTIARDKETILESPDEFGQEWQVLPSEGMLFHDIEGPQTPAKCNIPLASSLRRRLMDSGISEEEAGLACVHVGVEDFDMCVFDVMATGDKDVAGAY